MTLRVAVIGGSMGGLFAALLLLRQGVEVDIYERNATELAGRGAGIVTHARLRAAIEAAGLALPMIWVSWSSVAASSGAMAPWWPNSAFRS